MSCCSLTSKHFGALGDIPCGPFSLAGQLYLKTPHKDEKGCYMAYNVSTGERLQVEECGEVHQDRLIVGFVNLRWSDR